LATLERGLSILEALASVSPSRGLDHATLARRLDFSRSTLYRYLACLQDAGYIEEAEGAGRFRLGTRILFLAAVTHGREFSDCARDAVRDLAASTGETAHATVYDYPYSVTVQIESGEGPVGPRVKIGSSRPLHCCASGKVFLAFEHERVVAAYTARPLEAKTQRTITSVGTLRRLLAETRHVGYATDQGESHDGICGLAAPVFDFADKVVGTLSITIVATQMPEAQTKWLAARLLRCTHALSVRLGGTPRDRGTMSPDR